MLNEPEKETAPLEHVNIRGHLYLLVNFFPMGSINGQRCEKAKPVIALTTGHNSFPLRSSLPPSPSIGLFISLSPVAGVIIRSPTFKAHAVTVYIVIAPELRPAESSAIVCCRPVPVIACACMITVLVVFTEALVLIKAGILVTASTPIHRPFIAVSIVSVISP